MSLGRTFQGDKRVWWYLLDRHTCFQQRTHTIESKTSGTRLRYACILRLIGLRRTGTAVLGYSLRFCRDHAWQTGEMTNSCKVNSTRNVLRTATATVLSMFSVQNYHSSNSPNDPPVKLVLVTLVPSSIGEGAILHSNNKHEEPTLLCRILYMNGPTHHCPIQPDVALLEVVSVRSTRTKLK